MKTIKHIFTVLLMLCATTVATAHDFEAGGIYYNITDATNKTVSVMYQGDSYNAYSNEYTGDVVIPESVTYNGSTYSVTSIGNYAFRGCTGLTSIEIPNSVTSIGNHAFNGCTGLTSITIGNSVTSIGDLAFRGCTWLKSVVIGNSVTSIGERAFGNCTGLTSIKVESGNSVYDSRENCNAIIETATNELIVGCQNTIIPNSITSIGNYAFNGCTGLTSVVIPNSVTSIGSSAFSGCSGLTSVEIPNSVTSIGGGAFYNCTGLTSITIPNSVISIGGGAFYYCSGLKIVYNFSNLTFIKGSSSNGDVAYYADYVYNAPNGSMEGDFIFGKPDDVNTLLYYLGNATELTLPTDYKGENYVIGADVFKGNTTITSVVIGNGVTSIGSSAFYGCGGLKTVYNFSNLTFSKGSSNNGFVAYYADKVYNAPNGSIEGNFIFGKPNGVNTLVGYLGNATELTLPGDYNGENYVIGADVFNGNTTITSIEIPNSVTSIGGDAFYGCTGLTSVTIPNSVTSIGGDAFYGCTGLTSVEFNAENCTSMGSYRYPVFGGCAALSTVIIGENVKNIPAYAFYNCSGLTSIEIPNSVTSIVEAAFRGCTGLTSVVIGNGVTSIGSSAFEGCIGLKEVHISDIAAWCNIDFASYNANPLYYAKNLYLNGELVTDITIPNSVTSIGEGAFSWCDGLTSITIPNSVTSIGSDAFRECSGLTSVTIGDSVTSIGSSAFYGCGGLTSVVIGNGVTSIGSSAFYGCDGLKTVYNFSNLTFSKGSSNNGFVAYNADKVYNLPEGFIENDFVLGKVNGVNTLVGYLGNATELTLPGDYNGENYVIGPDVFNGNTTITSIEIPNSVTSIGEHAFYNCYRLTSITIGNSVTSIGDYAFYRCTGLTSIEIPNSVTSIGKWAFSYCTGLTSIVIGNSVTSIGNSAFTGCTGLKTVINFSNLTFSKGSSNNGYVAYYATKVINAPNAIIDGDFIWYENEDGMTLAGYLGNATELTLPADYKGKSVTSIGNYAFRDCTGLTSITIPNSVTSIGDYAFYECTGLTSITIPNSVTSIGDYAFYECTGLEKVCINDLAAWCGIDFGSADANPLYYAKNLYLNGELLTELSIPAEIAEVKDYAFYNCNGVTNIDIVDGVKSIGSNAFYGCSNLETLYLSNTIESIGDYAFAECNNILDIKNGSKKAITASENIFSSDAYYNNACLYVPEGRKFAYEKTAPWDNFYIVEMDFTGIDEVFDEVKAESGTNGRRPEGLKAKVKAIYDLNGRVVENPSSGIYIINGKKCWVSESND